MNKPICRFCLRELSEERALMGAESCSSQHANYHRSLTFLTKLQAKLRDHTLTAAQAPATISEPVPEPPLQD